MPAPAPDSPPDRPRRTRRPGQLLPREYARGLFVPTLKWLTRQLTVIWVWLSLLYLAAIGTVVCALWMLVSAAGALNEAVGIVPTLAAGLRILPILVVGVVLDRILAFCRVEHAQLNHFHERLFLVNSYKEAARAAVYTDDMASFHKIVNLMTSFDPFPKVVSGSQPTELERAREARAKLGSGFAWMYDRTLKRFTDRGTGTG